MINMKKFLSIAAILLISSISAQNISDYKYVSIPENGGDFKNNEYKLQSLLKSKLSEKQYEVLNDDKSLWPEELKSNPCNMLQAEILNASSFFKNKIKVDFKDCNGKIISSVEGSSSIKEYLPGYQEALSSAVKSLQTSTGILKLAEATPEKKVSQVQTPVVAVSEFKPSSTAPSKENKVNPSVYKKIVIDSEQFIIIEDKQSTPFATFKQSSKEGVFHVQLRGNVQTIGYMEDNNVVIDLPTSDKSYKKTFIPITN